MARFAFNVILIILVAIPISSGFEETDKQEIPFQWLETSRETSGVKYPTKKLQSLSPRSAFGTSLEIEEEEIEVDAQTTRIMRRAYMTSVNGERELIESAIEEIQKLPGDRIRAVRTISRKDINGRFQPSKREIQEVAPSGTDSFQITKTLLSQEPGGGFVERERIQQTERRRGDTSVDIERTRYEADINGKWSATEQRLSQNTMNGDQTRTDEQVYQNDVNNRLALTEKVEVTEWMDADGQRHRRSESYTPNLDGKLQLSGRTTIVQTASEDGRQETTEILEKADSANPGEGLKIVHKIVEELQNADQNEVVGQLEVMEPDLNGGWRSLHSEEFVDVK